VPDFDELELDILLEATYRKYGYDFRRYARASLRRRISLTAAALHLEDPFDLMRAVLRDRKIFDRFALNISVTVTEMFRDPGFYLAVRQQLVPRLLTYPFINVWFAGCATGEEVYSMAILFAEVGLLERTRFYATDFNTESLDTAQEGIYPLKHMSQYSRNYLAAGGTGAFSDYYTARYESAMIDKSLSQKMVFAHHNLATDGVFAEAILVVSRNVLIYFNRDLQERVLGILTQALAPLGFLALGSKETLDHSVVGERFSKVNDPFRIYQLQN
jgi:chemotaxis protein methyltransferase CheR